MIKCVCYDGGTMKTSQDNVNHYNNTESAGGVERHATTTEAAETIIDNEEAEWA